MIKTRRTWASVRNWSRDHVKPEERVPAAKKQESDLTVACACLLLVLLVVCLDYTRINTENGELRDRVRAHEEALKAMGPAGKLRCGDPIGGVIHCTEKR